MGTGNLQRTLTLSLKDGTAAGQADTLSKADTPLSAVRSTTTISRPVRDLHGDEAQFTAVKALVVEAGLLNTADPVVGGGTWLGPFSDASDRLRIRPGAWIELKTSDANGWPVADGCGHAADHLGGRRDLRADAGWA